MIDERTNAAEQATCTIDQLIREHERTPEQQRAYLRAGWVSDIISQLVRLRIDAGMTQQDLGERMGKQQSAIARLENSNDLKLSTLFDYLAALGFAPADEISVGSYADAVSQLGGNDVSEGQQSSSNMSGETAVLAAD